MSFFQSPIDSSNMAWKYDSLVLSPKRSPVKILRCGVALSSVQSLLTFFSISFLSCFPSLINPKISRSILYIPISRGPTQMLSSGIPIFQSGHFLHSFQYHSCRPFQHLHNDITFHPLYHVAEAPLRFSGAAFPWVPCLRYHDPSLGERPQVSRPYVRFRVRPPCESRGPVTLSSLPAAARPSLWRRDDEFYATRKTQREQEDGAGKGEREREPVIVR